MAVPEAISVKHLKALHSKPLQRSSTCFFDKEGSSHRGARTKQPNSKHESLASCSLYPRRRRRCAPTTHQVRWDRCWAIALVATPG